MSKYVTVSVQLILTTEEYEDLKDEAAFTVHGTLSEAIRDAMGWTQFPDGYLKWVKELEANAAAAGAPEGSGSDPSPREVAG